MLFAKWFVVIQPSPFFTAFQIQAHKEAEDSPSCQGWEAKYICWICCPLSEGWHTHSHLQPIYNNKHIFSVTIFVKRTAFLLCSLKRIISFPEISNTYSFMNEHGFTKTTLCECRSMKEPTKLSHFSSFTWSLAAVVEHEKISSSDWLVGPLTAGACTEVSRSQPASSCSHY